MSRIFCILFCVVSISSCDYINKRNEANDRDRVARSFNYFLYRDELSGIVPDGASREDSISMTRNFIDNWLRQKAILRKAEINLDDEKKNVEKQLEEYRNSLVTYTYETELVRQRLDTVVTEAEIENFYVKNKSNFELKDNIIRVIYLKVNKNSPKLNKAREWYKSQVEKDRRDLQEYCHQYALNYFLDDNTWLLFDDLLKEIPIKTYDKEQFLQNNRNIEIEDSVNVYLVSIKGFMMKNTTSPLSFEKNNIRNLIINQRKLTLIENMELEAYEDAKNSGDVEVY